MPASRSLPAQSLASAARQLSYALGQTPTVGGAFQKLYAEADDWQKSTFRQLESLLQSPESAEVMARADRHSPFQTLAWLLGQTASPERTAAPLFREYQRHQAFSSTTGVAIRSEFMGILAYLGTVLVVLVIVVGLYGLLVLPQFRSLYRGFGSELPTLTRVVFGGGAPLFALVLLVASGLLGFLVWFVYRLRRQLECFAPISVRYQRIPLVGPVAVAYHQYLWLAYAGLLRAAGVQGAEALRLASTRVPKNHGELWTAPAGPAVQTSMPESTAVASDLALAARLGKLDEEMQYQQEAAVDTFLDALARCRRRSRIVLTICVYYLVATFVSAMYLPIFSLGSAL